MQRRIARALAFCVPFVIFALSAHRHLMYWDMGEFALVPYIAGIAHPTGFPLYVMLGWLWTHSIPIGSVAFRMSLLSATCLACAATFLGAHIADETEHVWLGTACATLFAFGDIAWKVATRPDPHAMAILAFASLMYWMLRWRRTTEGTALVFAGISFGVGLAVHPIIALSFFGILLLFAGGVHYTTTRTMLLTVGGIALALLAYCYIPIRSAWYDAHPSNPTRFLGLGSGQPFFNYGDPSTPSRFLHYVTGAEFDVHGGLQSTAHLWGYTAHAGEFLSLALRELTPIGIIGAVVALIVTLRYDSLRGVALVMIALPCVAFAMNYAGEAEPTRYLLPVFFTSILLMGEVLGKLGKPMWVRNSITAVIFLAACILVHNNSDLFAQPYDRSATQFVGRVLTHTPDNAIIIAPWTFATPIAYASYVQGRAGGRILVPHWLDDVKHHVPAWLAERPVYVVDPQSESVPGHHLEVIDPDVELYRVF